ncbi:hypothetical protein [Afipia sp. GAS231]|uniref:hypothetical protein n=1 Tax=Afipia sp. GAS231 TaxID=1882747 RepID=UPI001560AFA2|nr:hypothetical protein [Afipia sp. GAS231]
MRSDSVVMDFAANDDFMTNDLVANDLMSSGFMVNDLIANNLLAMLRRAIAATPCVSRPPRTRAAREARSSHPTIPRC